MTITNPVLIGVRTHLATQRCALNEFIAKELVKQRFNVDPDLERLSDASGHLAEALLALDRVIGEGSQ
jgi:hypothetical protein